MAGDERSATDEPETMAIVTTKSSIKYVPKRFFIKPIRKDEKSTLERSEVETQPFSDIPKINRWSR